MRSAVPLLMGLALAGPALAQDRPQVSARLGAGIMRLGDTTHIRIQVDGAARAALLDLPLVEGLEIGPAGRPSTSVGYVSVRGRQSVQRRTSWSVPVKPQAVGEYEVPPLSVQADGTRLATTPLRIEVVEDLEGQDLGWLEIIPSSTRVVEGQPFTLELRLGWDEKIASQVNYAQLSLPWWDALPGVVDVELPAGAGGRVEAISLNGVKTVDARPGAEIESNGRTFLNFRARRGLIASRTGRLELEGSVLEFGRLEERGDFFSRRSVKVKNWYTAAAPLAIEVVRLPEEGRPLAYTGAVGGLHARASANLRDVVEGESIQFTVEWTGEGNLEFFGPPDLARLDSFAGFRVFGLIDEDDLPDRRRVTYDLVPASAEVTAIPPLPLPVFDPQRMQYVEVVTEPIPIRVRPLDGAGLEDLPDVERFSDDVTDIHTGPLSAGGVVPGVGTLAAALSMTGALWLGLRVFVRRRGDPDAPLERRRRRARRALTRALAGADGPAGELAALHAYLAAMTREPPQSWVGRDARRWFRVHRPEVLERHGEAVRSLDELLGRLECAAFGGADDRVGVRDVLAVADGLRGEAL